MSWLFHVYIILSIEYNFMASCLLPHVTKFSQNELTLSKCAPSGAYSFFLLELTSSEKVGRRENGRVASTHASAQGERGY